MALRPLFSKNLIRDTFQAAANQLHAKTLRGFIEIGEAAAELARSSTSYKDVTSHLRSSIGFIILYNGEVLHSDFGGGSGGQTGLSVAEELGVNHPQGWALILVAGMDYAAELESRGVDVLTSAQQLIARLAPRQMADLTR